MGLMKSGGSTSQSGTSNAGLGDVASLPPANNMILPSAMPPRSGMSFMDKLKGGLDKASKIAPQTSPYESQVPAWPAPEAVYAPSYQQALGQVPMNDIWSMLEDDGRMKRGGVLVGDRSGY